MQSWLLRAAHQWLLDRSTRRIFGRHVVRERSSRGGKADGSMLVQSIEEHMNDIGRICIHVWRYVRLTTEAMISKTGLHWAASLETCQKLTTQLISLWTNWLNCCCMLCNNNYKTDTMIDTRYHQKPLATQDKFFTLPIQNTIAEAL